MTMWSQRVLGTGQTGKKEVLVVKRGRCCGGNIHRVSSEPRDEAWTVGGRWGKAGDEVVGNRKGLFCVLGALERGRGETGTGAQGVAT